MSDSTSTAYLTMLSDQLRGYKSLAERAIDAVGDDDLHWQSDSDANSIAIIVKHISGNMRSRWTDFLTSDGEKPDRNRDSEFVPSETSREDMLRPWDSAWELTLETISSLGADDLHATVTVRGREQTVLRALNGQLAHYAYHVGQIVQIARHRASSSWETLSIAKNDSDAHNARSFARKR